MELVRFYAMAVKIAIFSALIGRLSEEDDAPKIALAFFIYFPSSSASNRSLRSTYLDWY